MRIRLRPKVDRHGRKYLFAGLEALNCVLFVHELATPDEHGCTHELVVKPYTGQRRGPVRNDGQGGAVSADDDEDYSAAWQEGTGNPLLPRRAA